jgi:hypothetical protein
MLKARGLDPRGDTRLEVAARDSWRLFRIMIMGEFVDGFEALAHVLLEATGSAPR